MLIHASQPNYIAMPQHRVQRAASSAYPSLDTTSHGYGYFSFSGSLKCTPTCTFGPRALLGRRRRCRGRRGGRCGGGGGGGGSSPNPSKGSRFTLPFRPRLMRGVASVAGSWSTASIVKSVNEKKRCIVFMLSVGLGDGGMV